MKTHVLMPIISKVPIPITDVVSDPQFNEDYLLSRLFAAEGGAIMKTKCFLNLYLKS